MTDNETVAYMRARDARRARWVAGVIITALAVVGVGWLVTKPTKAELQDRANREMSTQLQRNVDCAIRGCDD